MYISLRPELGSRSRAFLEEAGAVNNNYKEPEPLNLFRVSRSRFKLLKRLPGDGPLYKNSELKPIKEIYKTASRS